MKPPCVIKECEEPSHIRGMCKTDYESWYRNGTVKGEPYLVAGEKRDKCRVGTCDRLTFYKSDLCSAHKQRLDRTGELNESKLILDKDGKYTGADGYVYVSTKMFPSSFYTSGIVAEHIIVMSEEVGRRILSHETVHHKNALRNDNRAENLELWSGRHPTGSRVSDQIKWALELIDMYGTDPEKW